MKYQKINIGAYNLHFVKTDKFKSVNISVNFRRKVKKEEITIRKFLFSLLCYSSKTYATNRLLRIEQENLYLLSLLNGMQIIGNYVNSFIDVRFLNEKYTEEGIDTKALDFLFDILFNPNIYNKSFDLSSFNNIKTLLKTKINSIKENPDYYCLIKALENTDSLNPGSFRSVGYIEDLERITPENLLKYYNSILKGDLIDIFVVGDMDIDEYKNIFLEKFKINTIKRNKGNIYYTYNKFRKRSKKIVLQEKDLVQSKVGIIFKLINVKDIERKYIFPIYADILGGGTYSKLFQNIREKHSLTYSVSALTNPPCNIMMISAGIKKDNFNKTVKLVKKEIKNMQKIITEEELENAKNDMITNYNSVFDNPIEIINYYFGIEVLKSDTLESKIKAVKNVKVEDIKSFSKKVKLDTILLMNGDKENEED